MADGKVIIETGIDSSGATKGLKKLEKTIKSDTKSATKELDGQTNQLNKDLKKVGNTGSKAMNQISTGASKSSKSIDGLKLSLSKVAGILATAFSIHQLINLGKESINLASDLMEVQNVVDTAFGSMSQKMEDFADTAIETYGISKLTAKNIGSTYTAMARGMGQSLDEATDKALEMTGRVADIASFYNLSIDRANTIGRAVYSGETEPLKQIGVIMTEDQLAAFALANGYAKLYKNMSAAEKLEVRQAYFLNQTNLAARDFVKTQDSWANQTRILSERWKEFLSILGSGLIQILTPVLKMLNQILSAATSALIAFNKFLGINTEITSTGGGASSSLGDISSGMDDLTDSTDNATTAQKKLQKSLGEYDKLKVISKDTSSDVSGGSGASGIGSGLSNIDIKETVDTDKLQNNLLKNIDFFELGRNISNKLTEMLRNIPWDKIYEGARNFGTNLADFLNGLITPDLFYEVGATIAKTLNTVIYAALSFATRFDWANLGKSLAAGVNGLFENWDAAATAQAISKWVEGIWKLILNFFANLDYKMIFHKMYEFFSNLSPATVATLCGLLLFKVMFKKLIALHLGQAFREGLNEALTGSATTTVLQSKFSKLGALIGGYITKLKTNIGQAFKGIGASIGGIVTSIMGHIGSLLKTIGGIGSLIGGATLAGKSFFDMWNNGFNILDELLMGVGLTLAGVGAVLLGAPAAVAAAVAGIIFAASQLVLWVKENWEDIKKWSADLWKNLKQGWEDFSHNIKQGWTSFKTWWKDGWHNLTEDTKSGWQSLTQNLQDGWESCSTNLRNSWESFKTNWQEGWDNLSARVSEIWDNLTAWLRQDWEDFSGWFHDNWTTFKDWWGNAWNDVVDTFEAIWNTIVDIAVGPINAVIGLINGMIDGIEKAANFVVDCVNSISFDVPDWVPLIGGNHLGFNLSHVGLGRIPYLAQGAVIPPNKEFMAVLGDQKQGTNIETPLKTMIDAFNKALDDRGGTNDGDIIIEIDGKEVFRAVRKQNKDYKKITGKSALA